MKGTPEEQSLGRLLRHRYGELALGLAGEESFVARPMFGCVACYLHGRLKLVLADGERPWDGVLVPTAREHHTSLRRTMKALRVHPVLGKWLYLAASGDTFEDDARALAALALADDPRVGVEPKPHDTKGTASRGSRRRPQERA
ncbi:MAG: hypothetical protein ACREQL_15005 [Candidatus Binatia bacterium]